MSGISKIVKSCIFLCVLGLLCGSLIGFVNELTKDRISESEYNKSFEEVIKSGITKDSIKELEVDNKVEGINKIYRGLSIDDVPCYAFMVENTNEYTTVQVIVVIEIATEDILNVRVLSGSTTHQYDNKMSESKFGVAGLPIYDFEENFEIVTGATSSSNSVRTCLEAVKQQVSKLESNVVFKKIEQRIPNINMFEYTFETKTGDMILLLKYLETTATFEYVQTITEEEVSKEIIEEAIAIANINKPKNWIKNASTDAQGIKITVVTDKGNFGEIIAEFRVTNGKIISIDIKASNEKYHKNPNYTYEGDVEDYIVSQYELGIKNVIVTGATTTSKAINYMISLVEAYVSSTGGNK